MNSLDPRVKRLPKSINPGPLPPKEVLDQFSTFEVFVQPKDGKPFQHEGIVHSPNLEMAYVLAKETFTRRFTCVSLYVVETGIVTVSALTEGDNNVYELINPANESGIRASYEIYHLAKRGKQHIHVGTVEATSPLAALSAAKQNFNSGKVVFNVWAIPTAAIRFTSTEERDLWLTLHEKKFRDAAEYKGGDRLKAFLENRS